MADDLSLPLGTSLRRRSLLPVPPFLLIAGSLGFLTAIALGWLLFVKDPRASEPFAVVSIEKSAAKQKSEPAALPVASSARDPGERQSGGNSSRGADRHHHRRQERRAARSRRSQRSTPPRQRSPQSCKTVPKEIPWIRGSWKFPAMAPYRAWEMTARVRLTSMQAPPRQPPTANCRGSRSSSAD